VSDLPAICIIGCGSIGAAHANRLKGKAKLFFHSRRVESAERLNAQFGGDGVVDVFDGVLENQIDGVVIATPPEVHAVQTISALEASKAVFVEKPMCLNREEIRLIEDAIVGRTLLVGENYYYKPSLNLIKSWIDAGEIGELKRARIRKCMTQVTTDWRSGCGSLLEGGIHFIALMHGLFGEVTEVDEARFSTRKGADPERHANLKLSYGDWTAELEYGWDTPSVTKGVFQHSWIEGESGRILFESNGIYARLSGRRSAFHFPNLSDMMGYGAMFDDFLGCIQTGREPVSSFQRAASDLETVFQAYELGGLMA
jgi:predicted dehydrogenase